jgi:hypothetical protein
LIYCQHSGGVSGVGARKPGPARNSSWITTCIVL